MMEKSEIYHIYQDLINRETLNIDILAGGNSEVNEIEAIISAF